MGADTFCNSAGATGQMQGVSELQTLTLYNATQSDYEHSNNRLLLQYYKCWAELIVYSPFMHYVLQVEADATTPASATVFRGVQAAVQTVDIAEALMHQGGMDEANPLIVEALTMAAVVLLAFELSAPTGVVSQQVQHASTSAYSLLKTLAKQGSTALKGCLKSLEVSTQE